MWRQSRPCQAPAEKPSGPSKRPKGISYRKILGSHGLCGHSHRCLGMQPRSTYDRSSHPHDPANPTVDSEAKLAQSRLGPSEGLWRRRNGAQSLPLLCQVIWWGQDWPRQESRKESWLTQPTPHGHTPCRRRNKRQLQASSATLNITSGTEFSAHPRVPLTSMNQPVPEGVPSSPPGNLVREAP